MKNTYISRILAAVLSIVMILSLPLPVLAETQDEITIYDAINYLSPYEEAVSSLEKITEERSVDAAIYLCDDYGVKEEADPNSVTLANIACGQTVAITGVSQDSGKNIWYQITYNYFDGVVTGYMEREYLVSADERFLEWEGKYVKSKARSLDRYSTSSADIEQFPVSYRDALYALKQAHPNWTFVRMNTGLDWNRVITEESVKPRSLIWASGSLASWIDGKYDSSWAYCTPDIIKYYMDPRNFFDEKYIFQFEQLTYNASYHSVNSAQQILNGTFMSGLIPGTSATYASTFYDIGKSKNVSPTLLASRVRQEQGTAGTSPLISGTYAGYENLYNYYNIGASGQTDKAVIESGLAKAREMGWTSRTLSLSGGASFLTKNYISRGQDTLYLQKFDVDASDNTLFTHQYMQNIKAPTSEASTTYSAYQKLGLISGGSFVFKIPVYNNMPSYAVTKPGSKEVLTLSTTKVTNLPVDQTAVLNTYLNGSMNTAIPMSFSSSNKSVAAVDDKGVITGIAPGSATITCKRLENPETANTVTCSVSVIKADISLENVINPDITEVTYNPKQKLSDITLPQGYKWVDGSIIPTVENQGYSVIYNPDNSKYNSLTFTLPLTVKKAQIPESEIKLPETLSSEVGSELSAVALPQGFVWEKPDQILPKKAGTYQYKATYCIDAANYEIAEMDLDVTVINSSHESGEEEDPSKPVHVHSYTVSGTTATCTEAGVTTYTCGCGTSYTEDTSALGHNMVNGVCSRCGYAVPTPSPTTKPTAVPTTKPTATPTAAPTPTTKPTATATPTAKPTAVPTTKPTATPTAVPTTKPTAMPTTVPTAKPTATPTATPTQAKPEITGVVTPTPVPTQVKPEITSIVNQTAKPTTVPTAKPEITSVAEPTTAPAESKTPSAVQKVTPVPATVSEITPAVTPQSLNTVRINMQNESVLSADKIGKLADKEESLQLIMADDVTWYIDVASIADPENLNIDMAVTIGQADIPDTTAENAAEDRPYEVLSLAYDGPFDFDATLAIPVKEEYKGMVANLLYYNPDAKDFEFIGAAKVSEDGYAAFNMKHASDYMIVFAEASMETEYAKQSKIENQPQADDSQEAVETSSRSLKMQNSMLNIAMILILVLLVAAAIVITIIMFQIHNKKQAIEDAENEEHLEEERRMAEEAAKEAAKVKKDIARKQQQKKEDEYYLDEDDFLD